MEHLLIRDMSVAHLSMIVFGLSAPAAEPSAPTLGELMSSVIRSTNQERTRVGLAGLVENDRLVLIAQAMAEDLAKGNRLSHTDSKGRGLAARVDAGSYPWASIGENVAYGYSTPEAVVQGWIKSPGHYQNLVNRDFSEIGVGVAVAGNGKVYWAQVFGRQR